MLRSTGMGVEDLRRFSSAYRAGADDRERLHLLEEHRDRVAARVEAVQSHLAALEEKIARYRRALR